VSIFLYSRLVCVLCFGIGVSSVIVEILDACLACFCGAKFYIVRKSLGDGLTISRYVSCVLLNLKRINK